MEKQKRILAIHDISCMGRCSLTVALPILSAGGLETGILPTALLSTHTGEFKNYTYLDLTNEMIKILDHWKSLDIKFSSIYSGFLGSFEQIDIVKNIMKSFADKDCVKLVDPAMADHGKLYPTYTKEMAQGTKFLCQKADIVIPNITEASYLLGLPYSGENISKKEIEHMLFELVKMGPKQAVLTGISLENRPNMLGAASYDKQTKQVSYHMGPRHPGAYHGTGDVFSSVFLSGFLNGLNLSESTQLAVDFTQMSIKSSLSTENQDLRYGVRFESLLPFLTDKLFSKSSI